MADEVIDGAPEGAAEATDLRSTIVAAVEKQRAEAPAPEPELPLEDKPESPAKEAKPGGAETEAERNERLRDEKGKFATEKNAVKREEPVKTEVAKAGDETPKPEAASDQPALRPPPGWSPTAKVAFDKLPPEVQQAVAQREIEANKGFAKLSEYKPIDRYMEMARQGGTTLDKALEAYTGIENELRRDFAAGVTRICQNQGVHPVALANAILARYGDSSHQQDGPSHQQDGTGETPKVHQQAPGIDLSPVMQKISALENFIQQQQNQGVQTEIQRFASDAKHPFFENVKVIMGRLINSGQAEDLEDAYEQACWANKEIRELLIRKQSPAPSATAADAVQKARAAAKATGGAPSAGFKPNAGAESDSIRDTIRAAINAQRGI